MAKTVETLEAARLSRKQAAIVGAFTGVCCGPFSDIQEYAESVLGRPMWTHEFGTKEVSDELREASREDFIAICFDPEKEKATNV